MYKNCKKQIIQRIIIRKSNNNSMLEKIKDTIVENKSAIIYSLLGASLFSSYILYGRHELAKHHGIELIKKQNKLDTTFEQLLQDNRQQNIMKIVFTQADTSSGNYRKIVIDRIKEVFPQKDLGVLINCAPKKLFETGCEAFIHTFQHDDQEYVDYIINLLKEELLIEDTFQKIEKVSQPDGRLAIMLCDNNCLDILRIMTPRGVYLDQKLYKKALQRLNIKLVDLYDLYGLVIHFQQDSQDQTPEQVAENLKIERIWGDKSFRGFYQKFKYDNKKSKEDNVNLVIRFLQESIRDYQKQESDRKINLKN